MTTSLPTKSSNALLSVNFNQDHSCIAVGTRDGYSITNCEPFGRVYTNSSGPTSLVEMLFCTSLVALVATSDSDPKSNASPRRLQIVNTKRQSVICELLFPTAILGVKLNRRRLVVVLEQEIYIYDISNMKLLHTIETSPNPMAICALSPSSENCFLAYPSPVPSPTSPFANTAGASASSSASSSSNLSSTACSAGDVLIFDLLSLSVTNVIQAHKTSISALALNSTGTLLATASDKGTVIRVFSVPAAHKLHQFRRGSYAARIYSLSFNAVSTLLACSSDTETVHIFKLGPSSSSSNKFYSSTTGGGVGNLSPSLSSFDANSDTSSSPGSTNNGSSAGGAGGRAGGYEALMSVGGSNKSRSGGRSGGISGTLRRRSMALGRGISGSVGGYLPNSLTEMWEPSRDFAFLKLPTQGVSSVVALSATTPHVMVVTSEGYFYSYAIDLENGGECILQKQYSLMDGETDSNNNSSSNAGSKNGAGATTGDSL
ncbi:related to ATG18 - Phosphatidylinositol 3,5-bisphosphate-binding protein [Melanopsichium pennsylvanicum]|uniref:Autophagy-related protein 18 n=2 Tax=Melanopsichium pennsylvanicum TaxID=63383 RepID=A0AAJ4XP18_9BASI|nr:related to ATG18-Phosphatidylinositol 3,5-bisphosphate-binding protein [Melanopsichium pennsylvanicum 4]SNX86499.1 related to ATG18 - Phosphatidylinositol 3,5-bisphosphate-binding protein [Melanopsichium pennsylvanicum]